LKKGEVFPIFREEVRLKAGIPKKKKKAKKVMGRPRNDWTNPIHQPRIKWGIREGGTKKEKAPKKGGRGEWFPGGRVWIRRQRSWCHNPWINMKRRLGKFQLIRVRKILVY